MTHLIQNHPRLCAWLLFPICAIVASTMLLSAIGIVHLFWGFAEPDDFDEEEVNLGARHLRQVNGDRR